MTDNNQSTPAASAVKSPPGIVSRIRTYFLTGLVVAGPVAMTLWLIWWFVTWVDGLVRPFIPRTYRPETYLPVEIPGLGLIIGFVALTLLGFLTANLIGRKLVDFGEGTFEPHADSAADLSHRQANLPDAVLEIGIELPARRRSSNFRRLECGRWFFSPNRPTRKSPAACRRPSTSRPSCRARPIRPPDFSSTRRGAT